MNIEMRATLLLLALIGAAPVRAREIPTADFFKDPEFTTLTLSPDGRHMAITVPQADRTLLAVLTTADKKVVGKWDYGVNRHFREVLWANNERLLFRVGFKLGKFDYEVGKADLYASNVDGTKRIDIPNGNTYQLVDVTPDEPRTILVSRSVDSSYLSRLDVYTGKITTVSHAPVDGGTFLVDADGNPRYAFGVMQDGRQVTYRRDGDNWTQVHEGKRGGATYEPLGFAEDGKRVYLAKSDDGRAASVVLLDPETRKETVVSSNGTVSPVGYLWSTDRKTLLGVRYADGVPYWDFIAPNHPESKVFAGLDKAFPGQAVSFLDATQDGRYVALRTYSDKEPGTAYLFDRQTGKAEFLAATMDWIKPAEMAPMRPISVKTRDGLEIHGYLTTPAGSNGKKLPLIVNPHGGPHGPRDFWGFNPEVQFLANRGYAVLQMNYRGSGGYGNTFESAGYRKWGTAMQDDLTDSVRWAVREGIADADRICIYGASYGGYAALMSPMREPDLYRCTVGYVGVYSLPMMQRKGDIPQGEFGRFFLNDILPEGAADLQGSSPAYQVAKLKIPVMLVHGAKDERVPIAQMKFLVERMAAAGKTPEAIVVEAKEGHGFRDLANQVSLYDRMLAFFNRHIGPGAAPR